MLTLYEQAVAEGEMKDEIKGKIEGELETLKRLHEQGILPDDIFHSQVPVLEAQLQELHQKALSENDAG